MTNSQIFQAYVTAYLWKAKLLRYHLIHNLVRNMSFQKSIDRIIVWPPFDERGDAEALSSLRSDVQHYLSSLDVTIEYYLTMAESASRLKSMSMPAPSEKDITMSHCDASSALKRFQVAHYGVLWRQGGKISAHSLRPRLYTVDESIHYFGAVEWLRLVKDVYLDRSTLPIRTIPFPQYPVRSCAVLGTGPSIDLFETEGEQFDAWIGANAITVDAKIRHIGNPFALCALDPNLFSSRSSAQSWRTGLISLLRETRAVFVTTHDNAPFVELNFPDDVKQKCCYVRTLGHDTANVRTRFDLTDMQITPYGNVLVDLMLPVATAISKSITLYGCDGRPPEGTGNFPKASRFIQIEQRLASDFGRLYPEVVYRTQIDNMARYTRFVVDECIRQGVHIQIRCPSWNSGLAHIPLVN